MKKTPQSQFFIQHTRVDLLAEFFIQLSPLLVKLCIQEIERISAYTLSEKNSYLIPSDVESHLKSYFATLVQPRSCNQLQEAYVDMADNLPMESWYLISDEEELALEHDKSFTTSFGHAHNVPREA
jgi:hypothetical protein